MKDITISSQPRNHPLHGLSTFFMTQFLYLSCFTIHSNMSKLITWSGQLNFRLTSVDFIKCEFSKDSHNSPPSPYPLLRKSWNRELSEESYLFLAIMNSHFFSNCHCFFGLPPPPQKKKISLIFCIKQLLIIVEIFYILLKQPTS